MRGSERRWKGEQDQRRDVRATGGSRDCRKKEEKGGKGQYYRRKHHKSDKSTVKIHQIYMDGPLGCIRIFTLPVSLIAYDKQILGSRECGEEPDIQQYWPKPFTHPPGHSAPVLEQEVHVWTDGSALDNGLESCTVGAGWISNMEFMDCVSLTGIPLFINVAELAGIVLALLAWEIYSIIIHTDSMFMLGLVNRGLLAMEQDGWADTPRGLHHPSQLPLLWHLLFLLQNHQGSLSFKKAEAHGLDMRNNEVDRLANKGCMTGRPMDLSALDTPAGWIDVHPVLSHQSVAFLTSLVVCYKILTPSKMHHASCFMDRWTVLMYNLFKVILDVGKFISLVWGINIPTGFQETLWQEMNGAQPLDAPGWKGSIMIKSANVVSCCPWTIFS